MPGLLGALLLPGVVEAQAPEASGDPTVVLGFDGLDPDTVTSMIADGELPNLARMAAGGTLAPLGTTRPSESPVAWATFATGMNPGRTRIFDFLERRPGGYAPQIALVRQDVWRLPGPVFRAFLALFLAATLAALAARLVRPAFRLRVFAVALGVVTGGLLPVAMLLPETAPRALRARQGASFWALAGSAGVPSVALMAPMEFPVTESPGARILAGFGTPDVRKSFGLWSVYTTDLLEEESTETGGTRYPIRFEAGEAVSVVRGPRDFTEAPLERDQPEVEIPLTFRRLGDRLGIEVGEASLDLAPGDWSDFVEVEFPLNPLVRLRGLTRFRVVSLEPNVTVYMEPINFDPERLPPIVNLSWPRDFAAELAERSGPFETIGWKIVTNPLRDGELDFDAFLEDARFARETNERLLMDMLGADDWRLLVAVFLFPDRIQHMFYRFDDHDHPNHDEELARHYGGEIAEAYRQADEIVGRAVAAAPANARFLIVSDHGFHSFRKQFNVNTWLAEHGYLRPPEDAAEDRRLEDLFDPGALFFPGVDWGRSEAFGLGLSGIYFNQRGREPEGVVAPGPEREALAERLIRDLLAFRDPETGEPVVRAVHRREDIYQGPFVEEAPDLILGLEPGYRIGWQSTLGGFPEASITPNLDDWSGDHCSMEDTDGVVISDLALSDGASLRDIAPTVLELLGVEPPSDMDGVSLLER